MTTTSTTTNATTAIEAAFARATGQWVGLDWDGIRDTVAAIECAALQGETAVTRAWRRADEQQVTWYIGGGPASAEYQEHRRCLRGALASRYLDALRDLADEEETDVEKRASEAQQWAEIALENARKGNLAEAARSAAIAASIEYDYGDAPVWGPLARVCDEALRAAD